MHFESGQSSEQPQSGDGFPLPEPEGPEWSLLPNVRDRPIPEKDRAWGGTDQVGPIAWITMHVEELNSHGVKQTTYMVTLLSRLPAPTSARISKGAGEPHMLGLGGETATEDFLTLVRSVDLHPRPRHSA